MAAADDKLTSLRTHSEYYIRGGDLHFIVENYRFRVHSFFFERESVYFQERLKASPSVKNLPDGSSDSNAIQLDDVKSVAFERLLWVFYNPTYSLYTATVNEWSMILELAHKWDFPQVKALAIRELEEMGMSDVDRIVLYHNCSVEESYLVPCYSALCSREETITVEEGLKLGIATALQLARARECARSKWKANEGRSPLPDDFQDADMRSLIIESFNLPATLMNGSA